MNDSIEAQIRQEAAGRSGEFRIICLSCQGGSDHEKCLCANADTGTYVCKRTSCGIKGNFKHSATEKKLKAAYIWEKSRIVSEHPYPTRKQIRPSIMRVDMFNNWLNDYRDQHGEIRQIQMVNPEKVPGKTDKFFLSKEKNDGVGYTGAAYRIEGDPDTAYVCEGPATNHSIHEATGWTGYGVGGCSNFKHVVPWVIQKHKKVVVCADAGNGEAEARRVAQEYKLPFAAPGIPGTDFNDMAIDASLEAVKKVLESAGKPDNDPEEPNQWDEPLDMKTAIFKTPDSMPWLISERIPLARGIIITGLGGSSKTRVLYILAIGVVVCFIPWSWELAATGKAVLVLTEDTAQDVHRTIHYMARDLTDDQKHTLSENLIIYPLAGKDTRLMVKTPAGTVEKSPLFYSLRQKIVDLDGVVFIGLDPALSVSEGDELDQGHQRALGKMADDLAVQTGATVALVSHATKGSLIRQELTSHNSRGGGAITDAVRAEYSMRNMTIEEANQAGITDVEERKRHVQLVCTKGNAIPPSAFVPVWLRRDDFGNLAEADVQMGGEGTLIQRDLEVLKVHSEIGVFSTPKLADWRAACVKKGLITGDTENAQKQSMKRVLDKLLRAGLIATGIGRGIYVRTDKTTEPPF
jgi:RecA-family ATPase